jgi:hypothetical protein
MQQARDEREAEAEAKKDPDRDLRQRCLYTVINSMQGNPSTEDIMARAKTYHDWIKDGALPKKGASLSVVGDA